MATINNEASLDAAISGNQTPSTFTNSVVETKAPPAVTSNLTFDGQGDTLTGDGVDAALRIGSPATTGANATAAVNGSLTLENLNVTSAAGATAINVLTGSTLTFSDDGVAANGASTVTGSIYGGGGLNIVEGTRSSSSTDGNGNTTNTTTHSAVEVILNGANAFTGAITIGGAAGQGSSTTAPNPGSSPATTTTTNVGADQAATLVIGTNGSIANAASATVNQTGVLDFSSVQTSAGAGMAVGLHNLSGSGQVHLGQNTLVLTESTAGTTFSGDISGASQGGLTLQSGTLTLSGDNGYTGSTRIYGTLNVDNYDSIVNSANVALKQAGAVLNVAAVGGEEFNNVDIHQLSGVAGSHIYLGETEMEIIQNVAASTFSGVITDSAAGPTGSEATGGEVDVEGDQRLTFAGANTYSGGTYVDDGAKLALSGVGSVGSGYLEVDGDADMSGSTAGSITINGFYGEGTVELGSNRLVVQNETYEGDTYHSEFEGVISGTGAVQVGTAAQTAQLYLDGGAQTYTGSTVVYGALYLRDGASIASSANVGLRASGAVFDISGDAGAASVTINNASTTSTATTINQLTGVDGSTVAIGSQNLVVTETGSASFSGAITGSGNFVVRGPGTLTLSEGATSTANSAAFTGNVVVGGHLAIANATELANARLIDNGNVDISTAAPATGATAAVVEVASLGSTVGGSLTLGSNTLAITGGTNEISDTYAGTISGAGGLTVGLANVGNGGNLTLTGASTYTGATTIGTNGVLTLAGGTLSGTSGIADGGTLNVVGTEGTISAAITGAGTMRVQSTEAGAKGSVTLTGADTFTGTTTVVNSTVAVGAGGSISGTSNIILQGGVLDLSGATTAQSVHQITDVTNNFVPATQADGVVLGSANLMITGATGATATPTSVPAALTAVISGGTGQLQVGPQAALNLAAANTYAGSTVVYGDLYLTGAGTIADSANVSLKATAAVAATANAPATSAAHGVLDISGTTAATVTINTLTGQAGTDVVLGNHTLVIDQMAAGSFSGAVTGNGALTVEGSSYLTLNAASTYTGTTTIQGGYLELGSGTSSVTSGNTTTTTTTTGSIADSSHLVDNGFFAIAGAATVNDLSGSSAGVVKTMGNVLTDHLSTTDTFAGVIHGAGSLALTGSGTLVLSGASDFSGGVALGASTTLHLEAANSAGSGAITFASGSTGSLMIDNAALNGGGTATESFTNAIHGLGTATSAYVDLTDLSFSTATGSAGQSFGVNAAGDVTVTEGNVSVTLHLSDLTSGSVVASSDGAGGTHLHYQAGMAG